MATVTLSDVKKTYPGGVDAVRGVSLDIADGEFVVLVGPSGCGKSTVLRMIAGLEEISGGTVSIGGRVVNDVEPKDRDIAMVFQNYALYPHMTVRENMAFALKLRKMPRERIAHRVDATARMLGLEALLDRRPGELSGGQRQRVAVGRAIIREPKAFLFDEPLSNLDAKLRVATRAELKGLHQRLKTTSIYVTHDQEEAMTLGDRIVVMRDGVVQQVGPPLEVYRRPGNRFVASFVGTPPMNFLEGTLVSAKNALWFEEGSRDGHDNVRRLRVAPMHELELRALEGRPIVLGLRPQAWRTPGASDADRTWEMAVRVVEPLGDSMDVATGTTRHAITARIPAETGVKAGTDIRLAVRMDEAHWFEPSPEGERLVS